MTLRTVCGLLLAVAPAFAADSDFEPESEDHQVVTSLPRSSVGSAMTGSPLAFTANRGQWPDSILFRTAVNGATLWFTKNGIWYQFVEKTDPSTTRTSDPEAGTGAAPAEDFDNCQHRMMAMVKAEFVGASDAVEVVGLEEQEYKCNYFIGDDPSKWRSDVPNYSAVELRGLYPGVDVTFSAKDGRLTEEAVASANGDVGNVKVAYRGAISTTSRSDQTTMVRTALGDHLFAGALLAHEGESISSRTIATPTAAAPAIAATLEWSTFLGGSGIEAGGRDPNDAGVTVDNLGAVYVCSKTNSANFPSLSAYQPSLAGSYDACITKLAATGSSLLYSTYLGGSLDDDEAYGIAVNSSGEVFVTGLARSTYFPTTFGALQTVHGVNIDGFVAKLSSGGNALLYSTFLGGGWIDYCAAIALNSSGHAVVTGHTQSGAEFPITSGTYDATGMVFVTELNSDFSGVVYSTRFGGDLCCITRPEDIVIDADDEIYVTGYTRTWNFPSPNGFQTTASNCCATMDMFLVRLDPTQSGASSLIYGTYLGGLTDDWAHALAVDASKNVYIAGTTLSTDFDVTVGAAHGTLIGPASATISKICTNCTGAASLVYSSYWCEGDAYTIGLDTSGAVYLAGWAFSGLSVGRAIQSTPVANGDVFVTKFTSALNTFEYSTYLGGGNPEYPLGIWVEPSGGAAFVVGAAGIGFPTTSGAYDQTPDGSDMFICKIASPPDTDGDGFLDDVDNCPNAANPGQDNSDADVFGDVCDNCPAVSNSGQANSDGDLYGDACDNCPSLTNPVQGNLDADLYGDACDNCPAVTNNGQVNSDGDGFGDVCDNCASVTNPSQGNLDADVYGDACDNCPTVASADVTDGDGDLVGDVCDVCPAVADPLQTDTNGNGIGDLCEVAYALKIMVFSPIDLVVHDPMGDSVGIGFNTIGHGSSYDSTADVNSTNLSGPDGKPDDSVTIPVPMVGNYAIRLVPEPGALGSDKFTLAIRVNGNQLLVPDHYSEAPVSSLGSDSVPYTIVWAARQTLPGDCNSVGGITSADIIKLVNFVFKGDAPCGNGCHGDVNCSGTTTSADIINLVNYVFKAGAPPCSQSADVCY